MYKCYKCNECGHLFENGEEAIINEYKGEAWGQQIYEKYSACPVCKQTNYDEVSICKRCDEYGALEHNVFCEKCKEEIKAKFEKLLDDNFTDDEIDYIYEELL